MAARRSVPSRVTVAAGLLFLGYHVTTAVVLGATTLLLGAVTSPWPVWLSVLLLVGAVLGLLPAVVGRVGRWVTGRPVSVGVGDTAVALALMTVAWAAYSAGLVLLSPSSSWRDLAALGGAFALAYAVGVVVVLAPAGVGAREGVFVLLLSPLLDVADATALALLARVVHTVADGVMAAGWYVAARRAGPGRADRPRARTPRPLLPGRRAG